MEMIMNFIENGPSAELYQRETDFLLICYNAEREKVTETAYATIEEAAAAGEAWKMSWRPFE